MKNNRIGYGLKSRSLQAPYKNHRKFVLRNDFPFHIRCKSKALAGYTIITLLLKGREIGCRLKSRTPRLR